MSIRNLRRGFNQYGVIVEIKEPVSIRNRRFSGYLDVFIVEIKEPVSIRNPFV